MRFLKQQTINRRQLKSTTVYSDIAPSNAAAPGTNWNVWVNPVGGGALALPSGPTNQAPGNLSGTAGTNGMIRYNTTTSDVEVFTGGNWRALRYREPGSITQQNLGAGDGTNQYFGPLSPTPYNVVPQNGVTWDLTTIAKSIFVVVENVLQLSGTNYTIVQNPTIPTETYIGASSIDHSNGSTTIYFNTSLLVTGTTSNGSATVTGFINGTTMSITSGTGILLGMTLSGTGITGSPTVAQQNVASFNGYISTTTLTVTALNSGTIKLGMVLSGGSITSGTYISAQLTGTTGGAGTYTVSPSQTAGSSGSQISITGTNYTVSVSQTNTGSISITGTGTTAVLTFSARAAAPFAVGSTISVNGIKPTGYNGTYTVTYCDTTTVKYACTAIGSMLFQGTVTSTNAVYPAVNITGGTITGTGLTAGATISSYIVDSDTGALVSCTIPSGYTTSAAPQHNVSLTIVESARPISNYDYYVYFTSPVPYGKPVTVLAGFDR